MHNKTRFASVVAFILVFVSQSTYAHSKSDFHDAMRKLWEDHVTWTRLFIVSAAAGLPDKDATTQRLLQNQTDIGNAVADFYGRDAGNKHSRKRRINSKATTRRVSKITTTSSITSSEWPTCSATGSSRSSRRSSTRSRRS